MDTNDRAGNESGNFDAEHRATEVMPRTRVFQVELPKPALGAPWRTAWTAPFATGAGLRGEELHTRVYLVLGVLPVALLCGHSLRMVASAAGEGATTTLALGLAGAVGLALFQLAAIGFLGAFVWFMQSRMMGTASYREVVRALTLGALPLILAGAFMIFLGYSSLGGISNAGFQLRDDPMLPFNTITGMGMRFFAFLLLLPASLWSLVMTCCLLGGVCQLTPWHGLGIMSAAIFLARIVLPFMIPLLFFGGVFGLFSTMFWF